ncbi:hypothetical protein IWX88_000560 [Frigoribacterium sp. CG_9.8]|nr:hypothetical protein [Frigoribacterium sp. CG_9.8]
MSKGKRHWADRDGNKPRLESRELHFGHQWASPRNRQPGVCDDPLDVVLGERSGNEKLFQPASRLTISLGIQFSVSPLDEFPGEVVGYKDEFIA